MGATFLDLPYEILEAINNLLPIVSRISLRSTCRKTRHPRRPFTKTSWIHEANMHAKFELLCMGERDGQTSDHVFACAECLASHGETYFREQDRHRQGAPRKCLGTSCKLTIRAGWSMTLLQLKRFRSISSPSILLVYFQPAQRYSDSPGQYVASFSVAAPAPAPRASLSSSSSSSSSSYEHKALSPSKTPPLPTLLMYSPGTEFQLKKPRIEGRTLSHSSTVLFTPYHFWPRTLLGAAQQELVARLLALCPDVPSTPPPAALFDAGPRLPGLRWLPARLHGDSGMREALCGAIRAAIQGYGGGRELDLPLCPHARLSAALSGTFDEEFGLHYRCGRCASVAVFSVEQKLDVRVRCVGAEEVKRRAADLGWIEWVKSVFGELGVERLVWGIEGLGEDEEEEMETKPEPEKGMGEEGGPGIVNRIGGRARKNRRGELSLELHGEELWERMGEYTFTVSVTRDLGSCQALDPLWLGQLDPPDCGNG